MAETSISESIIKHEFNKSIEKFHVIACWVGLILNIVWFISDYFVIKEYLIPFLIFRLAVSLSAAVLIFFRNSLGLNIFTCMFILILGISIQNAYMWSVMDIAHFQKHAYAYMVLFIGVAMLALWELKFSFILAAITVIANIIFYKLNSILSVEDFLINGGLITLSVIIFCIFTIRTRYRLTYNEIKFRLELEHSKKLIEQKHEELLLQKIEIQSQKDSLEEKNREITDSINYAKNIQNAFIPSEQKFNSHFNDSFVLFKPKDIVSGDFYWIHEKNGTTFYVTADCTGHGVPGGFMTMLGLSFLDEIIVGQEVQDPAKVLNLMRDKIISTLNQSGNVGQNKDGMDITVCRINKNEKKLTFSSANNDIYLIRNNSKFENGKEFIEYKANRQSCGYSDLNKLFTSESISLNEGDCIYTFTDGFADQFGGPKGKKFRYKQFEEILINNSHLRFSAQKNLLNNMNNAWRGDHEQVDDILVIGIKI
ncbi:PP2C family protein-serine/threonine phosphatase [Aurantibacillus circumpalustris]|uniref:PP2C family protein-serine/threonine phosphatase n=1 Tax=Aurantibacillus circumpalustris TaxID=3036359 RepID=UPI00295BBE45|nr:SpoIIE family protein phosphatase [Aurantibacillus circumpalustris]